MGSVIDFNKRRQERRSTPAKAGAADANHVRCAHCGERHPIVRLKSGEYRCVSAFFDGTRWFCLHGGCRREWIARHGETP